LSSQPLTPPLIINAHLYPMIRYRKLGVSETVKCYFFIKNDRHA